MSSAITLNARASANLMGKLLPSRDALLVLALGRARPQGADMPRSVQASSLGAEDMVISHLIDTLELDVGIFALHDRHVARPDAGAARAAAGRFARDGDRVRAPSRGRGAVREARRHQLDVHTIERCDTERLESNPNGEVEPALQAPIAVLPNDVSRALGVLVPVDNVSHKTAGAALLH